MVQRAEIIWNTYASLRRDALLSERCSALCNRTLIDFANAVSGLRLEMAETPEFLRYLGDDALYRADRAVEQAVTGMN